MDRVHGNLVRRATRKSLPRLAKDKQMAEAMNCVKRKFLPNEKKKPEALNNFQDSGLSEEGMKGDERAGGSNEIGRLEGATVIHGGNRVRPLKLVNGRICYYRDEESIRKADAELHAMAAACRPCCGKIFTSEEAYRKHNKDLHGGFVITLGFDRIHTS
ncbi:unnamed protein product [Orchesella dallaii]|uniref:C2H2-type domain-containing protein n=1 Tax=Orchesella dallaii TaxID=48710 RepID=A0ABP1PVC4_9HEXA